MLEPMRARVDEMLEAHAGMDVVERAIEASPLPSEEKSVVWLWAWSRRHPASAPSRGPIRGHD